MVASRNPIRPSFALPGRNPTDFSLLNRSNAFSISGVIPSVLAITTSAFSNDANASYTDYKLGASYALPKDFTVGGYITGTSMNAAQTAFYTNAANTRFTGKDAFTLFVQKTF